MSRFTSIHTLRHEFIRQLDKAVLQSHSEICYDTVSDNFEAPLDALTLLDLVVDLWAQESMGDE